MLNHLLPVEGSGNWFAVEIVVYFVVGILVGIVVVTGTLLQEFLEVR